MTTEYYNIFHMFDYVDYDERYGKPEFPYKKVKMGGPLGADVKLTTSQYQIVASMGSDRVCEIKVYFGPKDYKDLAPMICHMIK